MNLQVLGQQVGVWLIICLIDNWEDVVGCLDYCFLFVDQLLDYFCCFWDVYVFCDDCKFDEFVIGVGGWKVECMDVFGNQVQGIL